MIVEIIGDNRSLSRAFASSSRQATRFEGAITGVGRSITSTLGAIGVAFAGVAVAGQIRETITAASDLNEQVNKSRVVFGQSSQAILDWSQTTASAFGLSRRAALEAAGGFGQILETSGLTQDRAAAMSKSLVELAADIASFNNIDPNEALDKLRSGLAGEAEPLRRVGVLLSEARVKQEAYRSGIAKTGDALTEGQKVQARYALILKDTATAQGDFARTSDSLANAQRRLSAGLDNIRASLGGVVLPAIASATSHFADFINRLGEARTVRAKISVVFDGLEGIGRDILNTVVGRLRDTDWQQVGRDVGRLLADGMSAVAAFLRTVDWAQVGSAIVSGISDFLRGVNWKAVAVATLKLLVAAFKANAQVMVGIGKELGRQFVLAIGRGVDDATDFVIRKLLQFVDKILGITSFLGRFDPFRGVRDSVRDRLREMEADAAKSTAAVQASIDAIHGKNVDVTVNINTKTAANRPGKQVGAGLIPDVLATFDLIDQQFDKAERFTKQQTARASGLVAEATRLQKARDRFAAVFGRSELAADRAAATPFLKDDIRDNEEQQRLVLQQIKIEGHTLELDRQLFEIQQKRADLQRQQRERTRAAEQARQFRALGLTAEGDKPTPTVANLRKQVEQVTGRIAGTSLDTKANRALLARLRKVLTDPIHKATLETRQKIKELLDALRGGFDDVAKSGPLTKTTGLNTKKILEGLGLDPETARELRARLSGFNTGGRALAGPSVATVSPTFGAFPGSVVVENHNTIMLDGQVLAKSVTRSQQRRRRRNPPQKRGPNRNV